MKVYETKDIRNVAVLGHGSAGKTTIVEAAAFVTGVISRMGKVTDGSTISDFDKEEVKRGFSLSTAVVPIEWEGKKIKQKQLKKCDTHAKAMEIVLDVLVGKDCTASEYDANDGKAHLVGIGVISDLKEIGAVGHRVLHGGEKFTASCLINDACIAAIEENIPLGPLHNPANLMGIRACQEVLPDVPQVAVFDTAFHQTMPGKAYMYAVPYDYYKNDGIRRYGFHGTSHRYVSSRCAELMGKPIEELKLISCHMGNGSSLAAIDGGKCVDTSMGFTPLVGLPMGTRCGDLDAGVIQFIMNKYGFSVDEML